ncbi:Hypothetical protein A7982_11014 [Minicystis rosea]|nr:Hypothetical protein A7982_11014 [Minicystis rosea]
MRGGIDEALTGARSIPSRLGISMREDGDAKTDEGSASLRSTPDEGAPEDGIS